MRDVLLITIDSVRADHVGTFGYDRKTTPQIDALAETGYSFDTAYTHGHGTRLSFPALLTSSSPLMYGGPSRISPDRTLIAELLDEAGYRTAGLHSNLFLSADVGYGRGFDEFYDGDSELSPTGKIRQTVRKRLNPDGLIYQVLQTAFDRTERHAGVELGSLYTKADEITDRAIDWLAGVDQERPTFLWVHYMDVHHPYVPPQEYQAMFRDDPIGDRRAIKLRQQMLDAPGELSDQDVQDLVDLYDAELRFTDAEIGRLVAAARTQLDDPVMIVTSDHGEEFGDHGGFSHGTFHEEGVRVPLILVDSTGSGRFDDLVGLLDVAPTIAEYAGADPPSTFHGHRLRRLLEGDDWPRTSVIGEDGDWEYDPDGNARERYEVFVRTDDWKYINRGDGVRLYNLAEDPAERQNVSGEHPAVVSRIEILVDDHWDDIEASYTDLRAVERDESVTDRLEQLGYRE